MDMQSRDFKWFLDNFKKLYQEYGNKVVAIKSEAVIGIYDSITVAIRETSKQETPGTFIVQELGADSSAYTSYIASINLFGERVG